MVTDRGLALLARKDRTSVGLARKRWGVSLEYADAAMEWRNVTGSRSRQLLRNMEHTAAVHAFMGALTAQAPLLGWEVVQLDPPRRASRYFRHDGGMRSVNPDAFGVLKRGETTWAFFLEWERRAVRPSTMSQRLAPYLRYYSSHHPTDDHGTRPAVPPRYAAADHDHPTTQFAPIPLEDPRPEYRLGVPSLISTQNHAGQDRGCPTHDGATDGPAETGQIWRDVGQWTRGAGL